MKLTQLSLVTIMIESFLMRAFAADTLADAFKEDQLAGEIKAEYSDSNFMGETHSDDISIFGGSLNFMTSDFMDLRRVSPFKPLI